MCVLCCTCREDARPPSARGFRPRSWPNRVPCPIRETAFASAAINSQRLHRGVVHNFFAGQPNALPEIGIPPSRPPDYAARTADAHERRAPDSRWRRRGIFPALGRLQHILFTIVLAVIFGPESILSGFFLSGGQHFDVRSAHVNDQNIRFCCFGMSARFGMSAPLRQITPNRYFLTPCVYMENGPTIPCRRVPEGRNIVAHRGSDGEHR